MWSKLKGSRLGLSLLIGSIVLVALGLAAVWLFAFHLPYVEAENTMDPAGVLTIREQPDGALLAQWPAGENADSYTLTVRQGEAVLFSQTTADTQCLLPELPQDETVTLQVTSGRSYGSKIRPGTQALEVRLFLAPPTVGDLQWSADPDTGLLQLRFTLDQGAACNLYTSQNEEQPQLIQAVPDGAVTLSFGEGGDYPMPEYGQTRSFWFEVTHTAQNLAFYGKPNAQLVLTREDFLGTGLKLSCERQPSNAYLLTWNETKGDHYQVQISRDGENWQTVQTVDKTQEHTYTTDHLDAFSDYQIRVLAVGGQTLPGSDYAAEPAVVEVHTLERAVRSTIWPHKELEVFSDPEMTQSLGTVPAGKAFCLLEEVGGAFGIRYGGGVGYIDSSYCMINLPEYLGDLCAYNITNSYDSLYMVHEYGIDKVSGEVIKGYESIQLADGSYVVPLLYPAAKKLVVAAQAAVEQGYRLKIYDSFRPNVATLSIFDLAKGILQDPVPKETFSGKKVDDLSKLRWDPNTQEDTSEDPTAPQETEAAWEGIIPGLTYEILMTDDGRWGLANFLAQGVSNHNRGVALDLTLETLEGKELEMQTSMHDLSWYSEAARNNTNAYLLRQIMMDAGFGGLGSEWWHYQDNEARDNLKPPALYWGVSIECWVHDSQGWRYRTADGTYLTDCTKTIDDISYTFDSQGYAQEQK